jgi:hypothetical protein
LKKVMRRPGATSASLVSSNPRLRYRCLAGPFFVPVDTTILSTVAAFFDVFHERSSDTLTKVVRVDHQPVNVEDAAFSPVRDRTHQPPFREETTEGLAAPSQGVGCVLQRRYVEGADQFGFHSVRGFLKAEDLQYLPLVGEVEIFEHVRALGSGLPVGVCTSITHRAA